MYVTNKTQLMIELQELEIEGKLNSIEVELRNELLASAGYDFRIGFIQFNYPYFATFHYLENVANYQISKCQSKNVLTVNIDNQVTYLKHDRRFILNLKSLRSKFTRENLTTTGRNLRNGIVLGAVYIGQIFNPSGFDIKDFELKQFTEIHKTSFISESIAAEENGSFLVQNSDSGSSIVPGASGFSGSNECTIITSWKSGKWLRYI